MIRQGFGGGNTSGPIDVAACLTAKGQRIDFDVETMVAQAIAFDCKGSEAQVDESGATPTLRAMGHAGSHANAGGQLAVAAPLTAGMPKSAARMPHEQGALLPVTVAFDAQAGGNTGLAIGEEVAGTLHGGGSHGWRAAVATRWAVRRLMPLECERLQGFPDGYTDVPYRRRNYTPDGPRYKALGNSMAVNAMEWLGQRIDHVRAVLAVQERKS